MSDRFFILEKKTVNKEGKMLSLEFFVVDENGDVLDGPLGSLAAAIAALKSLEMKAKAKLRSKEPSPGMP